MFAIDVAGHRVGVPELFVGFGEQDRLGLVMSEPCGAVGASALISSTVTAFYDIHRARGDDFFVYPDYYLFHVGRPLGDHARLDVWPRRKEVVVSEEPQEILEAIDDRAITRLIVEDGPPDETALDPEAVASALDPEAVASALDPEAVASARGRIATCLAYSPSGRVADADVRITSNPVTEGYVEAILDPETRLERLRNRGGNEALVAAIERRMGEISPYVRRRIAGSRADLVENGAPVETYRRIGLEEALARLGSAGSRRR
jgi:hypothetical protein